MRKLSTPLLLLCLLFSFTNAEAAGPLKAVKTPPGMAVQAVPRGPLPALATPLFYQLHFTVNPAKAAYEGEAVITISLDEASDHLWLHGRGLRVQSSTLTDASASSYAVRYRQLSPEGVVRIDFGRKLAPQTLSLQIVFSAAFGTAAQGLYKVERDGEFYAMTQLKALAARQTFPCFDEPRFRVATSLSLSLPAALTAVANSRQLAEEKSADGKMKTLLFARIEKLPTSQLAFALGPWALSESLVLRANRVRAVDIPMRLVAAKGGTGLAPEVLDAAKALLEALEDYSGVAYPYDKLDLLAAPALATGASSNPGLISILDQQLLQGAQAPLKTRQAAVRLLAQQVSQQWFGALVSAPTRDERWLSAATTDWMTTKLMVKLYPEWHAELETLAQTQATMAQDSLASARAIRDASSDLPVDGLPFDGFAAGKGAAVLSSLEHWIGEGNFRTGVRDYLLRHLYGTATVDDLISALQAASSKGEAFTLAARRFIDQPGLPLLEVTPQCIDGKGSVTLRQSRYPLTTATDTAASNSLWSLPVCIKAGHDDGSIERHCTLLQTAEQPLELGRCAAWLMPNADARSYYRFRLPEADFKALGGAFGQLNAAEQMATADATSNR